MRTRLPTPNDQWNSLLSIGPVQRRSGGGLERVLHLAEDLRLADDERIEAGGHAEQVPRRLVVVEREQMRREGVGAASW